MTDKVKTAWTDPLKLEEGMTSEKTQEVHVLGLSSDGKGLLVTTPLMWSDHHKWYHIHSGEMTQEQRGVHAHLIQSDERLTVVGRHHREHFETDADYEYMENLLGEDRTDRLSMELTKRIDQHLKIWERTEAVMKGGILISMDAAQSGGPQVTLTTIGGKVLGKINSAAGGLLLSFANAKFFIPEEPDVVAEDNVWVVKGDGNDVALLEDGTVGLNSLDEDAQEFFEKTEKRVRYTKGSK